MQISGRGGRFTSVFQIQCARAAPRGPRNRNRAGVRRLRAVACPRPPFPIGWGCKLLITLIIVLLLVRTLCGNRTVRYVTTVRLWGPTQERDLVKGRTTTTYDVRRPWRFTARHLALGRLLRARRATPLLNVRCGCDANCRVPTEAALPPKPEPKSGSRRARRRSASNVAPI